MGIEIERKFLLKSDDWKQESDQGTSIKQGYLNSAIERTVRIRVTGEKGILTIKGKNVNTSRPEYEYEIPYNEAVELLALCEKPFIEKTRYKVQVNGNVWEIDEFEGENKGLVVAEIELENEDQKFVIPNWIGKEVSDDVRYYNSSLIGRPYSVWR